MTSSSIKEGFGGFGNGKSSSQPQQEQSSYSYSGQENVTSGFHFRKRKDRLNWRLLASLQLEKVIKDVS